MDRVKVALPETAKRLGKSYHVARNLLFTGKIEGGKQDGKWFLYEDSVGQYILDRNAEADRQERLANAFSQPTG